MSILVSRESRVIVQGITGRVATSHTRLMLEYGTRVVAGVAPGRGGAEHLGLPVYETVEEARAREGADVSVLFLPPPAVMDGIIEAAYAGVPLIVSVTEGVPVHDAMRALATVQSAGCRLLGPNSPGLIAPGQAKVGFLPERAAAPGRVGVATRSGTLSYEVCYEMVRRGLGQSTWVGLGGDAVKGTGFTDVLAMFEADPETDAVVLIGEIGGQDEEAAASWIRERGSKPVVALIAGASAPRGRQMGHAGAIVSGDRGSYESKTRALRDAGVIVGGTPTEVVDILVQVGFGPR